MPVNRNIKSRAIFYILLATVFSLGILAFIFDSPVLLIIFLIIIIFSLPFIILAGEDVEE